MSPATNTADLAEPLNLETELISSVHILENLEGWNWEKLKKEKPVQEVHI